MTTVECQQTNKHTNIHIHKVYIQSKNWGNLFLPSIFQIFIFFKRPFPITVDRHFSTVGIQSAKISWPRFRKLLYSVYIFIPQKPSLGFSAAKISIRDLRKVTQPQRKGYNGKMGIYVVLWFSVFCCVFNPGQTYLCYLTISPCNFSKVLSLRRGTVPLNATVWHCSLSDILPK